MFPEMLYRNNEDMFFCFRIFFMRKISSDKEKLPETSFKIRAFRIVYFWWSVCNVNRIVILFARIDKFSVFVYQTVFSNTL